MRKIFISCLIALLFCLCAVPAFAFGQILYSDRPLNLRAERSPRGEWVGTLYAGQKVRVAHERDGWVAIYEPDATDPGESKAVGYSNSKYLKAKRTRYEPKEWGEMSYVESKLNVRAKPDAGSRKVMVLQPLQRVRVDFPEDNWIRVFAPDATIRSKLNNIGFCSAKYLKPVTANTPPAQGAKPAPEAEPATVAESEPEATAEAATPASTSVRLVRITRSVNVRQSRTTNSPLVRTLRPDDVVKIGLLQSGWYAIFSARDLINSESTSLGYGLRSLLDKNSVPETLGAGKSQFMGEVSTGPVSTAEEESSSGEKSESRSGIAPADVVKPEPAPEPEAISVPEKKEPAEPVAAETASRNKETVSLEDVRAQAMGLDSEPEKESKTPATRKTMVIDRSAFKDAKRPDPTPNKTAHGFKYRILEKSETRSDGRIWITLKVFVSTPKLPRSEDLRDFSATLWKEYRRVTKNVAVLLYLPGMNTDDLAYGIAKFDDSKLLEFWTRRVTLFGTKFM